jgi:non-specific serine/threonine protein kinase
VRQLSERPLRDSLRDRLRDQRALLLLDNFEHVLGAAPEVALVLEACPDVAVLVTSRAALRLRWEQVMEVPPLALPPPVSAPAPDALATAPAVALFVQRARAAAPGFGLDRWNAGAVAAVCRRLDGLPLALELAAARCPVLSPAEILARLPESLDLLTGGAPDYPARHRTLRAAIAWSYDLLAPGEQALLRRLAVFAGGCTLEGAAAVGGGGDDPGQGVLDGLATLVRASLVRRAAPPGAAPRFRLLETVRQYARERLEASGEAAAVRRRHAGYCLAVAERAAPGLEGPEQVAWLERLEAEHDDLRAALRWALEAGDAQHGQRLAGALGWFWWVRGYLTEGRAWLAGLLGLPGAAAPTLPRAGALDAAGFLAFQQADYAAALALHGEALALREALGDRRGLRHPLHGLGDARLFGGDPDGARALFERGLANADALGDRWGVALFCQHLALLAYVRGDRRAARTWYERALAGSRERGNPWGVAYARGGLGRLALAAGDAAAAGALHRESLAALRDVGDRFVLAFKLQDLAAVAAARGDAARALRLAGAAATLCEVAGYVTPPALRAQVDDVVAAARRALGPAAPAAWAEGRAMSPEAATALALAPDSPDAPAPRRGTPRPPPQALTAREREVAVLVARGLTNRQIGEALLITEGTARIHVGHVLAKLGFASRVQVAAWAAGRGLLAVARSGA